MKYYKFTPLPKTLIWGTESWQISGVAGSETLCSLGGEGSTPKTINDLVLEQKAALLGEANYQRFGDEFPLLIKFIDAHRDLSIQVHPSDEIARRQGKPRGKSEMWYVLESEPGASLYNGLKKQITPEKYKEMVDNKTICDALAKYEVSEGDCFFIPAGRIHAILHIKEASESIDYTVLSDYQTHYTPKKDESVPLIECPYFNTAVYDLTEPMEIDYSELDSFVVLIGLKGEGKLTIDGEEVVLHAGESILIPATTKEVRTEGTMKFLETYVLS